MAAQAAAAHRAAVLSAYRELLALVKRLPEAQRSSAWTEARQAMRQHAGEADEGKQQDLFKQLAARISFLRTVTPRASRERVSAIGAGERWDGGGRHGTWSAGLRRILLLAACCLM